MLLYELDASPLLVSIVGAVNQLKAQVDSGQKSPEMSENDLIDVLDNNQVFVDTDTLRSMATKPPLSNFLSIKDGQVTFKGYDKEKPEDKMADLEKKKEKEKNTVSSMADKAMKKDRTPKL
jgi:hypothetical protein